MTDTLDNSEWLDEILLNFAKRVESIPRGKTYTWYEEKQAILVHIAEELVKARQEMAAMYAAVGRDDISWGADGIPKEVLTVFPDYAKSTADIPRGKKQFMDFVQAQLLNGEKT